MVFTTCCLRWWTNRREGPLGLLSWGSDPYRYAPDGVASDGGTGDNGANLESGLDNGPVMEGVPFNKTGQYVQDEYDVGLTAMYLMDCQALISLAKSLGREEAVEGGRRRHQSSPRWCRHKRILRQLFVAKLLPQDLPESPRLLL